MTRLKTILHPTDFSQRADLAFQLACSLAQDHGARLIVLHVAPFLGGGSVNDEGLLWENLRDLQERYPHVPMELRLAHGDPAAETLHLATEAGCDIIVMGTQGKSGVGRFLLGSVAERVLRQASCPVLTVKDVPADVHLFGELIGEAVSRALGARDAEPSSI
jgi:nucleotide-binding universal stress UspA family protein